MSRVSIWETLGVDRTVLYNTKSLDGTKPNTNPNTNRIQLFHSFFEHRSMIFKLAEDRIMRFSQ